MSTSTKGRRYEHELASEIYERTGGDLVPIPVGYSGNYNIPAPDICIDDGRKVHAFELKKTTEDRKSLYYKPNNRNEDDIAQLLEFARDYPRTVVPYVGVRFDRRQLILATLWTNATDDIMSMRSAKNTVPTDVRLTSSDNLSFHKPDTTEWPSASVGDDVTYVLSTIGYEER